MTTIAIVLLVLAAIVASSALLSTWMHRSTRARIVRSLDEPPENVRIVILGCRPRLRSGAPNRYLVGRVASAAAAYHHTPGRRILCTGLADEASAMADALERASVPRDVIDLDGTSRRTIDSIDMVAVRHPNEHVLLVTQPFHLPRALCLARWRRVEAWGLIASGPMPGWRARMRERLAEVRAIVERLLGHRPELLR